jgi:pimeloyl-ACP methyl ester carboxylesterase
VIPYGSRVQFDSDGLRLSYYLASPSPNPSRKGRGAIRPIVLVHGFASDHELNWVGSRWQETLVDAGFLTLGLDLRGHGHSDKPHDPAAYSRQLMSADVIRLLDRLDIAQADYLGYSMGAWLGLEVGLRHGDRVGRMILGGTGMAAVTSRPARAQAIARRLRGDDGEDDPKAVMFHEFASARAINDLEALACCILGLQAPLTEADLGSIAMPVAVMAGDQDDQAGNAAQLAELLPHGLHVPLPGRNHMNAVPAWQFKQAALEFLGNFD